MKRTFLVCWALVAMLACWRVDPVARPLTGDNQLYFYLAERAASGVAPHVSHVDTKNQLGVLITAAAISTGRALGVDDVLASRLASIVFLAASVALAAELATLLAGSAAAGHLAALALLASRGLVEHSTTGNNVKVFLLAFVLLAHVAMARSGRSQQRSSAWYVCAGLAAGAAFLSWQPALLVVAALVVEALAGPRGSMRRAAILLGAALLPVAGYELYFALHGAIGEQLHQAYVMTLGSVHSPVRLLHSLGFVFTEATGTLFPMRVGPLSWALLTAGALLFAASSPQNATALLRSRAGLLAFAIAGTAATLFTVYDHQGVPDLFFPDPYFAVATGLLTVAVMRAAKGSALRQLHSLVPIVVAVALVAQFGRDAMLRRVPNYDLDDQKRAAAVVREQHDTVGSVWAYGAVHLLGLAHLDNHVPFGLFFDDVESVLAADSFVPLRDGRMPELILQSRRPLPGAAVYIDRDYSEITPEEFRSQGVRAWRRLAPRGADLAEKHAAD